MRIKKIIIKKEDCSTSSQLSQMMSRPKSWEKDKIPFLVPSSHSLWSCLWLYLSFIWTLRDYFLITTLFLPQPPLQPLQTPLRCSYITWRPTPSLWAGKITPQTPNPVLSAGTTSTWSPRQSSAYQNSKRQSFQVTCFCLLTPFKISLFEIMGKAAV